jgi:hypothetical protein
MLRRMLRRHAAIWAAVILTCSVFQAQNANLEDRLKATFIYNFVQYAEWPRQSLATAASFNICIVGDSFQSAMEEAVRGEHIGGREIIVRSISTPAAAANCQLIYFRDAGRTASDILSAAKDLPILTVGESRDFIQAGGIIRFTKAGNRIRFEINPLAAEKQSLALSSRLLRLADIVRFP